MRPALPQHIVEQLQRRHAADLDRINKTFANQRAGRRYAEQARMQRGAFIGCYLLVLVWLAAIGTWSLMS